MIRTPLPREEVIKAIKFGKPERVPMAIHFWHSPHAHGEEVGKAQQMQAEYPMDLKVVNLRTPAVWRDPSDTTSLSTYTWMPTPPPPTPVSTESKGLDSHALISDWGMLDDILAQWPDPSDPALYAGLAQDVKEDAQGRYVLLAWWFCLYERMWSLRGMENIMCDFHENPDEVNRLMDAITDFNCKLIRAASHHIKADGIFCSDDIGMQTGPMFSPATFKKFFKHRYEKIFRTAHECGLHFWLHTCGNVKPFLPELIDIGLDVIHPIQKYTMNEQEIAREFGGKICFWTGMDVQQILPRGTPEDVRREVRFMIDTFDTSRGGCIVTCGNGITADMPLDNLRAFYDEAYHYGAKHRQESLATV